MAAPVFIAGQHTATLGGSPIGMTKAGFHLRTTLHEDPIQTDEGGQTTLDAVNAGGDVYCMLDWCEYTKVITAIQSQIADDGQFQSLIGTLKSAIANALVLTPVAGLGNTRVLTATKAVVVTDLDFVIARKLREGPLTLRLQPDLALSGTDYGRAYKWA